MKWLGALDIKLDWVTANLGNGEIRWTAARANQPDLVVELRAQGSLHWQTAVYTVRGISRRAKGVSDYWRDGHSRKEAEAHLKSIFEDLNA